MSKIGPSAVFGALAIVAAYPASAQHHISCRPVAERNADLGCWIMRREELGQLPQQPLYWHIDIYPTRAAAEADKGPRGTVVEAAGKIWLFTIESEWRAPNGQRATKLGPLPIGDAERHAAVYMETLLPPGFSAPIHRHPGPEVVYPLAGEVCIETPDGHTVAHPGGANHVIGAGVPMALTVTGSEHHRSLVLILIDASKPAVIPVSDWTPTGLCRS
jgi:quercetin dioxygenase-like cupin family protein